MSANQSIESRLETALYALPSQRPLWRNNLSRQEKDRYDAWFHLSSAFDEIDQLGAEGLAAVCIEALRRLREGKTEKHRNALLFVLSQSAAVAKPLKHQLKKFQHASPPKVAISPGTNFATELAKFFQNQLMMIVSKPHIFVYDVIVAGDDDLSEATLKIIKQGDIGTWCRKNYRAWAKAAKPLFEARYGKEFQTHPEFADYRKRTSGDATLKEKRPKLYPSRYALRDAIWKDIVQGFKVIAPINPMPEEYALGYKSSEIISEADDSNIVQHPNTNECGDAHRAVRVPSAKRRVA